MRCIPRSSRSRKRNKHSQGCVFREGTHPFCYVNHFEKYRPRSQSGKIYGSLSVMTPAACRFVLERKDAWIASGYALRWGQRDQGEFRFSPLDRKLNSREFIRSFQFPDAPPRCFAHWARSAPIPVDTPYPLQTTRVATLDPGMQLFLCFPKDTGLNQTCFLVGLPEDVIL